MPLCGHKVHATLVDTQVSLAHVSSYVATCMCVCVCVCVCVYAYCVSRRSYHGTISYLPAQFGLLAAAHVINDLVQGPMAAAYASLATHQWITEERERAKQERAAKRRGGGGGSSASISAAVQVKRSAAISKSNTAAKQSRPQSAAGSKDTQAHSEPVQHASEAVKHDSLQARPSQSPSPRPAQQQRELVQSSSYMSVRAGSLDLASYQDTSYADYGMDI